MSRDILIDLIDADPDQPRRHFDADQLGELAESIAANGLIVPILLRPVGERFVIVHGERRFRACQSLGWSSLPAEVRDLDVETAKWMALVENIQRADLSPIEESQAYAAALATGLTQQQLGKRIGKTQSYIAQKLRLLKMAPEVQAALAAGTLTEGIARQLLRLDATKENWRKVVDRCVAEDWSVRRAKNYVDLQLLVFYPQWWDVEGKFADLVEFEKRLQTDCTAGYASTEDLLRTQRALGHHLNLGERVWNCVAPAMAVLMLEEWPLSLLNEYGKWLAKCDGYGIDARTAMKARLFLDADVDERHANFLADVDFENIDRASAFCTIVQRAGALFDKEAPFQFEEQVSSVSTEVNRHERATDTSFATVPLEVAVSR